MVGDNYYDVLVGKNVGIKMVGVVWMIKGLEILVKYEFDYMFEKMSDLL